MHNLKSLFVLALCGFLLFTQAVHADAEKARVAIDPVSIAETIPAASLVGFSAPQVRADLERSVLAIRKFTVLTRERSKLNNIRDEQNFAQLREVSAGDAARQGRISNAHYLVMPTVNNFMLERKSVAIPNIDGRFIHKDKGLLNLSVQVIDSETSRITAAFSVEETIEVEPPLSDGNAPLPASLLFGKLSDRVSAKFADKLLNYIYPMTVIKVDGKTLWLNRGEDGGLKKGQILHVYSKGEALIDPDTKDNLGYAEAYIGEIKVIRINPKFTIAEWLGNDGYQVVQNSIVRVPE